MSNNLYTNQKPMKLLDLFCCCGGISKGFHDAGWECVGVDITDNHQYPYEFIQSDVFGLIAKGLDFFKQFDLIHASPPCQAYSFASQGNRNKGHEYPDLVGMTRDLLLDIYSRTRIPFMIENVIGAPVRKDLVLCGEMFGLRVIRHRVFELNGFTVMQPPHIKHKLPITHKRIEQKWSRSYYATVAGHGGGSYSFKLKDWQDAMGIDWVDKKEHLTQMIPPKYSEYIAKSINL